MKQIGLAMHNYHNVNDCFPPAALAKYLGGNNVSGTLENNYDCSAHARLLANMEQQALYNAMNFNWGVFNDTTGTPINATVTVTRINSFLCPSDTIGWSFVSGETAPLPNSRRRAITTSPARARRSSSPASRMGARPMGCSSTRARSVTAGSGSAISATGRATRSPLASGGSARATPTRSRSRISSSSESYPSGTTRNNGTLNMPNPTLVAGLPAWIQSCVKTWSSNGGRQAKTPSIGEAWAIGINAFSMGNVLQAPNPQNPNCMTSSSGVDNPSMMGLRSYHPGGANVLIGDGSVRFLKNSTAQMTIWALGSIAQGEVIDANSY